MFFLLWIAFFLGRYFHHDGNGFIASQLEIISMVCLGTVFIMTLPLLAIDIITGFGFLFPQSRDTLRTCALVAGALLTLFALVQGMRPPVIQNYIVYLPDLPEDLDKTTVVAISDTHIGSILGSEWLSNRITQILEQKPDLIFILGDFFEGHGIQETDLPDLLQVLQRLSAPLGVWAVPGNHDSYGKDNKSMEILEISGIRVLRNQLIQIKFGFNLIGIDHGRRGERQSEKNSDFIEKTLGNLPKGTTLFLSHKPQAVPEADRAGVGLMLSGHTHGGQIWPFNYLVQRRFPYLEGLYEFDNMSLLVSRGAGTWGPRMRLWQPGEILHITLRKGIKK
ncbi:MAG: metallophosphoesterase [Candidatus Electrothrix sp. AR3]|nr:metallophosphoesterase [Candidatus Electrothrix sp. AR3]